MARFNIVETFHVFNFYHKHLFTYSVELTFVQIFVIKPNKTIEFDILIYYLIARTCAIVPFHQTKKEYQSASFYILPLL